MKLYLTAIAYALAGYFFAVASAQAQTDPVKRQQHMHCVIGANTLGRIYQFHQDYDLGRDELRLLISEWLPENDARGGVELTIRMGVLTETPVEDVWAAFYRGCMSVLDEGA